jgi:hypothetical protein
MSSQQSPVTARRYLEPVAEPTAEETDSATQGGAAGGSAQRRYEELAAKDAAERRAVRTRSILMVVGLTLAAGAAVFGATQIANVAYGRWITSQPSLAESPTTDIFTTQLALLLTGVAMVGAASTLSRAAWGRRQTTEAYGIGAEGERAAARLLNPLADLGWVMLHDRRVPKGRENIDHIAIGPGGIAVVETKNWSGKVLVTADALRRNGRDANGAVEQVLRQVAAIQATGVLNDSEEWIRPIIYVHRAQIERKGSRRRPARPQGVRVCGPRDLVPAITDGPNVLSAEQVKTIADELESRLKPS